MSTPRMMKRLTNDSLEKSSRTITHHTSEPELLDHYNIDTAYYHPSKHPHASIRDSFDSKSSPEQHAKNKKQAATDDQNIDSQEESRLSLKK